MAFQKKGTAKAAAKALQDKEYRTPHEKAGQTVILNVGKTNKLLYFDEKKGYQRAIRHCPNERSPFVDEQSDNAVVSPIILEGGYLEVKKNRQSTQQFLSLSPQNKANGGPWFEEINEEQDAIVSTQVEDLKLDLKIAVRDKEKDKEGIYDMEAEVAVILGDVQQASEMSKAELKRELFSKINNDPFYFTDGDGKVTLFEDEYVIRKFLTLRSIKEGVLKVSPNQKKMAWSNDSFIYEAAPGRELIDTFADYLATKEGALVLERVKKELG